MSDFRFTGVPDVTGGAPDLALTEDHCRALTWFTNSPDAGHPDCLCSHCGKTFKEGEMVLRLWVSQSQDGTVITGGVEARLHLVCHGLVLAGPEAAAAYSPEDAQ